MSKKVLIVGSSGLLGKALVGQLLDRNYEISLIDKVQDNLSTKFPNPRFFKADICDAESVKSIFKGVDICVVLAALSGGVNFYNSHPAKILSTNNKIIDAVFNLCQKSQVGRVIYVSSSAVYENCVTFPYAEVNANQQMPSSSYAYSKLQGEMYCKAFSEEYGMRYTILRPFNIYGPFNHVNPVMGHSHVIPDLIQRIAHGQQPLKIFGDGTQTRCFTHVSDVADGIVRSIESPQANNEDFNLGSDQETSILSLVHLISNLLGRKNSIDLSFIPRMKNDPQRQLSDSSKARSILGWSAKVSLEIGLKQVIAETQFCKNKWRDRIHNNSVPVYV